LNAERVDALEAGPCPRSSRKERDMLSDMELIELQAMTLFRYDVNGRMLCLNEDDPEEPAPRLFLGRTKAGTIWCFRSDLPDALIHDLEHLLRVEPIATDLGQASQILPDLIAALNVQEPVQKTWTGPAWRFPDELEPPEDVVAITRSNVEALQRHYPWSFSHLEDLQPCMAVIVNGEAVALCFSSRTSPAAAGAGVFTVEACRGRGYATSVVAAWARSIRESNRVPLYSTSWDNLASRSIAKKLGLVLYGADLWIN